MHQYVSTVQFSYPTYSKK